MHIIRTIEEASLNAWPPLQQQLLDGWLLRFADGYTRRANSVNAIYAGAMDGTPNGVMGGAMDGVMGGTMGGAMDGTPDGTMDPATKVALCEQIYRDSPLGCVFKITPLAQPPQLDGLLEKLGYRRDAETSVRVLPGLSKLDGAAGGEGELTLGEGAPGPWLDLYCRMNGVAEAHRAALSGILANIPVRRAFATLKVNGLPVACGLGVLEGESLGLFDIVTAPEQRRRGFSNRLMAGLMAWAGDAGATQAYLQVMLNNAPALRLYDKLGFQEIYRYWYRIKP